MKKEIENLKSDNTKLINDQKQKEDEHSNTIKAMKNEIEKFEIR